MQFDDAELHVEQATAAPGEKRLVLGNFAPGYVVYFCETSVQLIGEEGSYHCALTHGHDGPHRFEYADGE